MKANNVPTIYRQTPGLLALVMSFLLGFMTWPAFAQPQLGPNGNYYEVVLVPESINWPDAKAAAEQRSYQGRTGHLATLTNEEEDVFAEYLRQQTPPIFGNDQLWIGGYQLPNQLTTRDGWYWVNNEGPIPGANGGASYTHWRGGEPNDCCVTTDFEDNEENHLAIGLFSEFTWNDDGPGGTGQLFGYLVEYDAIIVGIDIKPGSATNPILLDMPGRVPVAILSSATFDAATADRTTITFGRYGTEALVLSTTLSDVNGDKRKDLVCQFEILDAGLLCGDTAANLRGKTIGGVPFLGTDILQVKSCPPYDLSIVALQDVNHVTDVELKVSAILPGYAPPTVAQSTVLKSYDLTSKLRWTKTLQNTALTPIDSLSSAATVQYSDMERFQKVRGKMLVAGNRTTYVLCEEATVLLRPDLAVDRIEVPPIANVRQLVTIPAYIRELNGDLSATADVYLMEGNTILDTALQVSVPAHASMAVVFTAMFREAGPHELKVVIGNVNPGDFDPSNNEKTASLEVVVPALQMVDSYLSYSRTEYDYLDQSSSPYWISSYSQVGKEEAFYQYLYIPTALNFPIPSLQFAAQVDGVPAVDLDTTGIPLAYFYDDGCIRYQSGFQDLGNGYYVQVDSYGGPCYGSEFSYVYINKYAADWVVFSRYHDLYYGTISEYTYENHFGTFLDANVRLDTRFIVDGGAGAFGGNMALLEFFTYPYDNVWNYDVDYGDYVVHYEGHQHYRNIYSSFFGQTTP